MGSAMSAVSVGVSTDGTVVAEAVIGDRGVSVADLLEQAAAHSAGLVWAHGGDLESAGFTRVRGYIRLHAGQPSHPGLAQPGASVLAEIVETTVEPGLRTDAYLGAWGHKRVAGAEAAQWNAEMTASGRVTLGLVEHGQLIGLCDVFLVQRLVDGPGIVQPFRTAWRKSQLVGAACALLGPGPVDLDTWGEDADALAAYRLRGFEIVVEDAGWELRVLR
jgi:hypothetical protein